MSRVNIGKHVKDDHYRYTMEPLQLKIEGRGNGIKTILVNVANTAVDLKVPPMYITKYFGYELGAQATHDAKNEKYIVNGAFDNHTTDKLLDDFISKFVLCPKCKLPEIDLIVDTKTENIGMNCKACGSQSKVSPKEKLHKFILTHPPPKPKPLKKPPAGTQEDTTETKPTVKAATSVSASDESWSSDLSEEAVKKRRAEELVASKMLGNQEEESDEEKEELGEKSPTQVLKEYLELKPESTDAATIKVVQKIKSDYGLRSKDVICLLFEALYETKDILKEIPKRAKVFKTFLKEMKVPQQGQATIIGYLEDLVFNNKELLKQLPKICEALYDADVVSEEVFVAWHAEKKSKYVKDAEALKKIKDAAAPFITWLQEASDDDEEEEDDE